VEHPVYPKRKKPLGASLAVSLSDTSTSAWGSSEDDSKCMGLISSLRGFTEFPQVVSQLCVSAIENGGLASFIAMLAHFNFELQSEIIGGRGHDIQKRLSDFDIDFLPFFERVCRAIQVQILVTCLPPVFQSILRRFVDQPSMILENEKLRDRADHVYRRSQRNSFEWLANRCAAHIWKFSRKQISRSYTKDRF
jgi:hypothetical protein